MEKASWGQYTSIEEIRAANEAAGEFWFSPNTLKFFESIIDREVVGGCLFVSSEKPPHGLRHFTVRMAVVGGGIETVGEFGEHRTLAAALAAARIYATLHAPTARS